MVAQTSVVLAFRLLKQETHEFKTSMGYKAISRLVWARSEVRPCSGKNKDSVSFSSKFPPGCIFAPFPLSQLSLICHHCRLHFLEFYANGILYQKLLLARQLYFSSLSAITLRVIHVEMLIVSYCSAPLRCADVLQFYLFTCCNLDLKSWLLQTKLLYFVYKSWIIPKTVLLTASKKPLSHVKCQQACSPSYSGD